MTNQFKINPALKIIKPAYEGNIIDSDGRFLNYQKVKAPKFKDIWKWRTNRKLVKNNKLQNPFKLSVMQLDEINNQDKLIWFGHASFLITLNGKNIITDPVFNNIMLVKRLVGVPCTLELLTNIDYILISHAHFDHLDKKSLYKLCQQNPNAVIYCGLNHVSLIRKFNINNVIVEAAWYQEFPINLSDKIEFYFMPALHWYKRTLKDRNIRLWGSFVIRTQNHSIYFMGDSGYSTHFKEIGTLFGGFEYCIMGIGAYTPAYIMQGSHTNPEEAVQGFHDLNGKNFVPMHYGTYDVADEPIGEPIERIYKLNNSNKIDGKLVAPKIGEIIYL